MFLRHTISPPLPFIADREAALDAARLIEDHGECASDVAAANAGLFRDRGNAVSFCRWRQIERLIDILTEADGEQTRH